MKITDITPQQKNKNRANVFVDGVYRFSLDIFQISELGIKIGRDYSQQEIVAFEDESQFGKLYARALEYCLMRPHSGKEVRDYLYRKTQSTRGQKGEIKKEISRQIAGRVFDRLVEKGYIDDEKFTRYWIENRNLIKGVSRRKLQAELRSKGVEVTTIDNLLSESERSEEEELKKVIARKSRLYHDTNKFMVYLARQGFSFDAIKTALKEEN